MADVTVRTLDGVAAQVSTGDHEFLVDEPPPLGANRGPDPYELLLSALGACTAITTMLYARRKGWPLEAVVVHLTHAREHTRRLRERRLLRQRRGARRARGARSTTTSATGSTTSRPAARSRARWRAASRSCTSERVVRR